MSFPLIREKVKRGAITENKQKDLTKSSSTLLVDEEALSLLFFIFLSPLSLKSLFAGERFGMVTTAPTTRRLTTDKRSTKRAANNLASTSCKVTY